jgi:hypothetical protein
MRHSALVALAAALGALGLAAGCGGGTAPQPPAPAPDGPARLVVREVPLELPRYTEGSISHLRLERLGGERPLFDGPVTSRPHGGDQGVLRLLARTLPPGEYRLVSHQEPGFGSPPMDRCARVVRLAPARTTTATVVLHQAGGCTIRVAVGSTG